MTEREKITAQLDGFLTSALTIHDVMKAVPHPYDALAPMASKWAHDFVGLAFTLQRELDKRDAEISKLREELKGLS